MRSGKPRLADIAAAAGVSIATVSRVLADHPAITPETKIRVLALAEAQGYSADTSSKLPRKIRVRRPSRSSSVCVVMPVALTAGSPLANSFELNLLGGIGAAMRDHGVDFSVSSQSPFDDRSLIKFMAEHPYHGIIFVGQSQFHAGLNSLAGGPRPFVVWGVDAPDQKYCSVGSDNFEGSLRATRHLLELGRRRIAFVGQAAPITSAQTGLSQLAARVAGFKAAHAASGYAHGNVMMRPHGPGRNAGNDAVEELLDQAIAFDGLVTSSDYIAAGAIEALLRRGLAVPGDVSVIGYDDSEIADFIRPKLTSMRQDPILAGDLLVAKLLRLMTGHEVRSERLPTQITIRESCGGHQGQ
nr:LacI family DNA-binding transcriptional regulator [Novosphingobium sp.]